MQIRKVKNRRAGRRSTVASSVQPDPAAVSGSRSPSTLPSHESGLIRLGPGEVVSFGPVVIAPPPAGDPPIDWGQPYWNALSKHRMGHPDHAKLQIEAIWDGKVLIDIIDKNPQGIARARAFINASRQAIVAENWLAALISALVLPDIFAGLEWPAETRSSIRYKRWMAAYAPGFALTPEDCYALRCTVLHDGDDEIADQKVKPVLDRVILLAPQDSRVRIKYDRQEMHEVHVLVGQLLNHAERWVATRAEVDPLIEAEADHLLRIWPKNSYVPVCDGKAHAIQYLNDNALDARIKAAFDVRWLAAGRTIPLEYTNPRPPAGQTTAPGDEVHQLRARIAELEAELAAARSAMASASPMPPSAS